MLSVSRGRGSAKQRKIGAASNEGHQSFFGRPPPSGKLCAVHVRDAGDIVISIPFPCAFSFLILQYALRFPGGGGRPKKRKIGAASNQGRQFFLVDPPPLGNSVRSMSATLATLRCLCDVCYCDVARDVTVSLNKNTA